VSGRRHWLLIALGGAALAASYPPFRLPVLSFVALVPPVLLLRDAAGNPRLAFRLGFRYGVVANGLVLYWMLVALWHFTAFAALGYVVTVFLLGVFTGGLFWLVTRTRLAAPVLPLALVFPVAWTALEWAVGHLGDAAFPWLGVGTSLADAPLLVQWADLAGARGVTLWLVWCNVLLAGSLGVDRRSWPRVALRAWLPVGATILAAVGYGEWRERTVALRDVGKLSLVQPNIGFDEKWDAAIADSEVGLLLSLSREARAVTRPDLVIWPEAALPYFLTERPAWQEAISRFASEGRTPVLTGGVHVQFHADGSYDTFNAAFFFDSLGRWRPYPVYEKHYLVPVVERVPFVPVGWFRALPGLGRWSGGYGRGRTLPVYDAAVGRFGVLICYESAFEDLARRYRQAGADFLVNITNDAWFGRTSAPSQHASHLVLRAIETRMGIARDANDGISEFVDPLGRVTQPSRLEAQTVVTGRLLTSDVRTIYVRWGDWVGTLAVLATVGFGGVLVAQRWGRSHGAGR
jgi:apolipoprotein N-acyltransferase